MRLLFIFIITLLPGLLQGQKLYRGIVVDSASLVNLPGVHVTVRKTAKVSLTDANGTFLIYAKPTDTLTLSFIGYQSLQLPLLFEEEDLFILLREDKILLNEIVIKSTRLYPNKIEDRTAVKPKTMDQLDGMLSPFDYFWKVEREKRKLSRVVEENNRTQVYRQVITDPDVKNIMKKEYGIDEETYYSIIEKFNQQHPSVHYYSDPDAVMEALHQFFERFRVN